MAAVIARRRVSLAASAVRSRGAAREVAQQAPSSSVAAPSAAGRAGRGWRRRPARDWLGPLRSAAGWWRGEYAEEGRAAAGRSQRARRGGTARPSSTASVIVVTPMTTPSPPSQMPVGGCGEAGHDAGERTAEEGAQAQHHRTRIDDDTGASVIGIIMPRRRRPTRRSVRTRPANAGPPCDTGACQTRPSSRQRASSRAVAWSRSRIIGRVGQADKVCRSMFRMPS